MKLVVPVAMLVGCIEPNLTHCPGDYDCAPGLACDVIHHGCVEQDQLDVCADLPPLAPCATATVSGECFDKVCLPPGCGNRVVEVGEQCDDGNHVSGDGCSLDCASTEQCGNGVVDLAFGETCDDGNFASHDGCNSTCTTEPAAWQAYPITISTFDAHGAAFDPTRHRLVYAAKHTTWEWDGSAWHIASLAQALVSSWAAVVYEPQQHRMIGFGSPAAGAKTIVAEWDGATWKELALGGGPPIGMVTAVYDPARGAILAITASSTQYLDLANGTWRDPAPITTFDPTGVVAAFDAAKSVVVAIGPNTAVTWQFDGATWSSPGGRPATADSGWALAWEPDKQVVVAIGGVKAGVTYDGSVSTWDGTKWTAGSTTVKPRAGGFAYYDPTTSNLVLYSGSDATGPLGDFANVLGTTAIAATPVQPPAAGPLFYDPTRHRLLMFGNMVQWSWDGAWTVVPGRPATPVDLVAYDPVRGAVVAHAASSGLTWLLDDTWHSMPSGASLGAQFPTIGTYDYANRRIVAVDGTDTLALSSTDSTWTRLGGGVATPGSAAYDLGAGTVAVLGSTADTGLSDLVGDQWVSSLSPGSGYSVASVFARGSVLMVPTGGGPRQVWERRNGTFATIGTLPVAGYAVGGIVETSNGRVLIAIDDGDTSYLLEYRYGSGAPDESCVPGEDLDGDGLAGCDDPDCWEQCWPACPFATSCS